MENWDVRDPIGEPEEVFRQVRDEIEQRVLRLVLALRIAQAGARRNAGSGGREPRPG